MIPRYYLTVDDKTVTDMFVSPLRDSKRDCLPIFYHQDYKGIFVSPYFPIGW